MAVTNMETVRFYLRFDHSYKLTPGAPGLSLAGRRDRRGGGGAEPRLVGRAARLDAARPTHLAARGRPVRGADALGLSVAPALSSGAMARTVQLVRPICP